MGVNADASLPQGVVTGSNSSFTQRGHLKSSSGRLPSGPSSSLLSPSEGPRARFTALPSHAEVLLPCGTVAACVAESWAARVEALSAFTAFSSARRSECCMSRFKPTCNASAASSYSSSTCSAFPLYRYAVALRHGQSVGQQPMLLAVAKRLDAEGNITRCCLDPKFS